MKSHLGISDLQNDYKLFLLSKLTSAVHNLIGDNENVLLQVDLCRRIEMVLFYGVRNRAFKWKTEAHDIWNLLKEISSKHIVEDIQLLKSVKTDAGRIRAWIRITINESTLQSYFQLITDRKLTKRYYECWCLFNDNQAMTKIIKLISMITDSACKVIFNCDSFDFEGVPSAADLSTINSPAPPRRTSDGRWSSEASSLGADDTTSSGAVPEIPDKTSVGSVEEPETSEILPSTSPESSRNCQSGSSQVSVESVCLQSDSSKQDELHIHESSDDKSNNSSSALLDGSNDDKSNNDSSALPVESSEEKSNTSGPDIAVLSQEKIFSHDLLSSPEPCPIHEEKADECNEKDIVPEQEVLSSVTIDQDFSSKEAAQSSVVTEILSTAVPESDEQDTHTSSPDDTPLATSQLFPPNLVSSSPRQQETTDMLPGTPKDQAICDQDIYKLRQTMGNSLQTSRDKLSGEEMIAQQVFDDPYPDDGSSAKSLSRHTSGCSTDPAIDNLLQHLEADEQDAFPVPGAVLPDEYEPHSLGSSLYRLFSRSTAESKQPSPSAHLTNLARFHSAVVDDVPVASEETTTRSYLMGAGRATAAYTYQSANQWFSLSKDMWWWLQNRVIPEHECQHPTPPQSDQLDGSPNSSSLLEICTEQCPCCNAVVIDYCSSDQAAPRDKPISSSCPPFSNLTHQMQQRATTAGAGGRAPQYSGGSTDYFNLDILDNPAPALTTLNEAIELQKERTLQSQDEEKKRKEVELLVHLRKKKHDLTNPVAEPAPPAATPDPDSVSELTILGHVLVRSSKLSGYCSKCAGGIYPRLLTAYSCVACGIILHKTCINDVSRHCSLANKDSLKLITEIAPAHGLHEQNYCCYDCGSEIAYSATKVHVCDYNGRYYCSECHKKTPSVIPARILHNWDFKMKQVALQSHEIVSYLMEREYLNVEEINPRLFDTVSVMQEIRELREQIILFKAHFIQCGKALREGQFLKLRARQHFIDTSKSYTVQDLLDTKEGILLTELQGVVAEYQLHIRECGTCSHQKFLCAVCSVPPLISPFTDEYSIAQCPQCHGLLHRACFNRSQSCPYCTATLVNE